MIRNTLFFIMILLAAGVLHGQEIAYHPSKHWHVPGRLQITSQRPLFNTFFPQYGYPKRLLNGSWQENEWENWSKKNAFSAPYKLNGHAWQAVIERNKEVFQRRPELLAEVNGKRLGYAKTSKFCVSDKDLQALFIRDRIKAFEDAQNPGGAVSVEPSDGGGFCECSECKKLGSISNQVFHLANLTAKALRSRFPNGKVNLLAYYLHTDPPGFALEPNVHVTVIPEGFHNKYDPDVILNLWAQKTKHLTYYEYFSIPQWRGDLPRLHMQNYLHRMDLVRKLGYQGFWFETGLNLNAAIALQLFNQLWLNPQLTWTDVSEQFLRASFEGSYVPMKRLFTRWWHTWIPEQEVAMALNDLSEATALARSKDERERLADLKAYVRYIILYQEWEKDVKNEKTAAAVFNYVYNSANRLILHPIAFYSLYEKHLPKSNPGKYNMFVNSDWSWVKPLTTEMINKNFEEDVKNYGRKPNNFSFTPLSAVVPQKWKNNLPQQTLQLRAQLSEKLYVQGKGRLQIELINPSDLNPPQNDQGLYIGVARADGTLVSWNFVPLKKPVLTVQLPVEGMYSITFSQFFQTDIKMSGTIIPVLTYEQRKRFEKDGAVEKSKAVFAEDAAKLSSFYYLIPK
jgi:hypothetical protein